MDHVRSLLLFFLTYLLLLIHCWSFHLDSSSSNHWFGVQQGISWLIFILFSRSQAVSKNTSSFSNLSCGCRSIRSLAHSFPLYKLELLLSSLKLYQIPPLCWWHPAVHLSIALLSNSVPHLKYSPIPKLCTYLSWKKNSNKCARSTHPRLNSFWALVQNNNGSNFLISQILISRTVFNHHKQKLKLFCS